MALRGIKVVELAGLAPAPFCGMVLADFGAQVLRVDKVANPTDLDVLGNGKQSIALNLKSSEGVEILKSICNKSDVLIEPFRPGVMEKLGLGPDALCAANERLIYARLTGYGQTGPYRHKAGHDINYVGVSGLLSLFGRKHEKPIFPANLVADFGGGGLSCALGVLLALLERAASGRGQVVDCAMAEGAAYLGSWLFRSQELPIWGGARGANLLDSGAPCYEVYETKDGKYVTVGALEPHFYANLLAGLGLGEEVGQMEDWQGNKALFERVFREKTQAEWGEVFDGIDACVAPVVDWSEASEDRHNRARGSFAKSDVPRPAPVLSRTPGVSSGLRPAPKVGEHTRAILKGLGYKEDEVQRMIREGAVGCFTNSKL